MTGYGHRWVGIYTTAIVAPLAFQHDMTGFLMALGTLTGARAPDYLEIQKRGGGTVIPHRTITHWTPLWVVLFALSALNLNILDTTVNPLPMPLYVAEFLAGFALSGLLHLLCDLPNPMGIPVLLPNKRISLNLWKSGQLEWAVHIVGVALLVYTFQFSYQPIVQAYI